MHPSNTIMLFLQTEFLNAYIRDPNRPNLPPAPQSSGHSGDSASRVDMGAGGPPAPMGWGRRPMYGGKSSQVITRIHVLDCCSPQLLLDGFHLLQRCFQLQGS